MNAGEINIAVTADMNRFEATMDAVRKDAGQTAMTAGRFFREKFMSELSPQKLGKILGAAIGINFADAMIQNMTEAIRNDSSIAEALAKQFTSLPVIGSLISLGNVLEERLSGRAQDRAEGIARALNDAALAEEYARQDKAFADELEARKATEERIKNIRTSIEEEQLALKIQNAKRFQDEEEVIRLEFIQRLKQIEKQQAAELLKSTTDDERNAIFDLSNARIALARSEMEEKRKQYEQQKEQERKDMLEKLLAERQKLLDDQAASLTAGIGSAQTALGTFKFDAYPAAAKKRNDERTNQLLSDINDKIERNGGFM